MRIVVTSLTCSPDVVNVVVSIFLMMQLDLIVFDANHMNFAVADQFSGMGRSKRCAMRFRICTSHAHTQIDALLSPCCADCACLFFLKALATREERSPCLGTTAHPTGQTARVVLVSRST